MKKIVMYALLALAAFPASDGIVKTVADERREIPEIVQPANGATSEKERDYGTGAALDFITVGILGGIATVVGRNGTAKIVHFNFEHVVKIGDNFPPSEVVDGLNKSEEGLSTLVEYICDELKLKKPVVERIKAVMEINKAVVSVKGFLHAETPEKINQLSDLFRKLIEEKVTKASELMPNLGNFQQAIEQAVQNEIDEGKEKLVELLRGFRAK